MNLFHREHYHWNNRDSSYNTADDHDYGRFPMDVANELVTQETKTLYIDFSIEVEPESSYVPRNSEYRDDSYIFYYYLVISNQDSEFTKKLFSRHYREFGNPEIKGDMKYEMEDLDKPKTIRGLENYFKPLVSHLSINNSFSRDDSTLSSLYQSIVSVVPEVQKDSNKAYNGERVILNFLDSRTAKEQNEANRIREQESALFSGPMKWITLRFYFVFGKAPTRSNRTKLVMNAMNSLGSSLDFDIFDFRCNTENYKAWYESWITYVKTEGKKQIVRLLNRLSTYNDCVSSLVELESVEKIINKVCGRSDFELSFDFSGGSEHKDGKKQRKKGNQKTDSMSVYLGLLGLDAIPETMDELKKAYRNACFAFHPDRFSDAGKKKWAEEQIKKISNAFDELSKLYA